MVIIHIFMLSQNLTTVKTSWSSGEQKCRILRVLGQQASTYLGTVRQLCRHWSSTQWCLKQCHRTRVLPRPNIMLNVKKVVARWGWQEASWRLPSCFPPSRLLSQPQHPTNKNTNKYKSRPQLPNKYKHKQVQIKTTTTNKYKHKQIQITATKPNNYKPKPQHPTNINTNKCKSKSQYTSKVNTNQSHNTQQK